MRRDAIHGVRVPALSPADAINGVPTDVSIHSLGRDLIFTEEYRLYLKGSERVKILLLADIADKALWDYLDRSLLEDIGLVLACGDLPAEYLSFLTCFTHAPILYVHGNHDSGYEKKPPEGCVCVEDTIYTVNGLRILGLGGSMKYRHAPHMYNEREMALRAWKLGWKLFRNKGFDILLTHAPARGVGDQDDLPHRGFETFKRLMDRYHPRYMVHGHVHPQYAAMDFKRERKYGETTVVNAYKRYVIEI